MKYFCIRTLPGVALLLGCLPAGGAAEEISFQQAVAEALRANRELTAAHFLVDEAEGRLRQARAWPNLELEVEARDGRLTGGSDNQEYFVALAQRFPLGGRLARAREVGRVDVALARAEIRNRERLLAGEALAAFADILTEQEHLALQRTFLESQEEFLATARARAEAAEVSVLDVNLAEVDAERARQEIRRREARILRRKSDLHYLMGREGRATWNASGTLEELISSMAELREREEVIARPDVEILLLQANRAEAEITLARAEAWGDARVALGVGHEADRGPGQRERDTYVGVAVTFPLPVFDRRQGTIAAGRAARGRYAGSAEALRAKIENERHAIAEQLAVLESLRRGGEEVLAPRLEANADLLSQAYAQGQMSMNDLLQAQERLYRLSAEQLDVAGELARTLVELQTLLGAHAHPQDPTPSRNSKGNLNQ